LFDDCPTFAHALGLGKNEEALSDGHVSNPGHGPGLHRHGHRRHLGRLGRQAQATERSLAQTERSLAEQVQSLREQNERSRLNLEVDLLFRMVDRFESPHFLSRRRIATRHIADSALVEDEVEVKRFNRAAFDVANFFEQLGYLQRLRALQTESVWHTFGRITQVYWAVYGSAIRKMRRTERP
jgi:hypothetical protein